MARNTITKKILCASLALTSAFASMAMMTACETSHPEVSMKLSFNGKTYTLEYELYRKLTPATAAHFLELVEANYYDGLCVHDYTASSWGMGGYEYDATKTEEGGLVYRDYFTEVKKISNFPISVYTDQNKSAATYTLYGEFKGNDFKTKNGSVSNGFGALTMYYTDKGTNAPKVWTVRQSDGQLAPKEYGMNSATSMFTMNVSSSTSAYNDRCTFATLKDGSVDDLQALQSAIASYIEDYSEDETFAPETEVTINEGDPFVSSGMDDFNVPEKPIVIEEMKVIKW